MKMYVTLSREKGKSWEFHGNHDTDVEVYININDAKQNVDYLNKAVFRRNGEIIHIDFKYVEVDVDSGE